MSKDFEIIRKKYGTAIVNYRKRFSPKISQDKLCENVNNRINKTAKSYLLDQKKLSRIENGFHSIYIPFETVKALNEICNIPDEISCPFMELMINNIVKSIENPILIKEHGEILTQPVGTELNTYLGKYFCYFYSTDSANPKLIEGEMVLSVDEQKADTCIAQFTIYEESKPIKTYNGQFFINRYYRMSYCVLIGESYQEVSVLFSNHFNATIKKNLLNVALALTTSAGSQKRPTMHRMIITRKKPDNKQLTILKAQLKLNTDELWISEKELQMLKNDLINDSILDDKHIKEISKCIDYIMNNGHKETYYHIPESVLYDGDLVIGDPDLRSFIVSYIRNKTNIPYYNKISDTVRDICLDIIKHR